MIGEVKEVFSDMWQWSVTGMNRLRLAMAASTILVGTFVSGLAVGQEASWVVNPGLQDRWTLNRRVRSRGRYDRPSEWSVR